MRRLPSSCIIAALIAAIGYASPVVAEDLKAESDYEISPEQIARTTSFIWFATGAAFTDNKKLLQPVVSEQKIKAKWYDDEQGVLVALATSQARKLVEDAKTRDAIIESNAVVYGSDTGCEQPTPFDTGDEAELPTIKRVTGTFIPTSYTGPATVWIVDSGVADDFDGAPANHRELNVIQRLKCNDAGCVPETLVRKDKIGHGTMIAGIIGAEENDRGVVGVAPGVKIRSLRIYAGRRAKTNIDVALEAVKHLEQQLNQGVLKAGDVINISWGAKFTADSTTSLGKIESKLRNLAEAGVRISVAAGNREAEDNSGYVETLSPARLGGFRKLANGGAIVTASSVATVEGITPGVWTDTFSEDSFFGNGSSRGGAPDFAEPGADVMSLWPKKNTNVCSGTSFAAAHLSGILVWGIPTEDGEAQFDPSALLPGKIMTTPPDIDDFDTTLFDPVGKKP